MKNKLYYIQWEDHFGSTEQVWRKYEDIEEEDLRPLLIESVGWVRYETPKVIGVVPHKYQDESDIMCGQGEIFILKNCIKKKRHLK